MMGLRNPDKFKSISALAPLGHPTNWEVSRKAFTSYLGADDHGWLVIRGEQIYRANRR